MTSVSAWIGEDQNAFFEREGYLHLKGVYSAQEVQDMIGEYDRIWMDLLADGQIVQAPNRPLNSLFPRLRDYHREHEAIVRFIVGPQIVGILQALLGEDPLAIQTSYYFKAPGASGLPLHQDNYSIGAVPDTTYAAWVSLDPSDSENGGLHLVPRSQSLAIASPESVPERVTVYGKRLRVPEGYDVVDIPTEPGDVVLFNGNLLHGSTDNRSRYRFRRALVTHYARVSVEKITLNYNYLINKHGDKARRRFNTQPKVLETKANVFEFAEAKYYDQIIKRD